MILGGRLLWGHSTLFRVPKSCQHLQTLYLYQVSTYSSIVLIRSVITIKWPVSSQYTEIISCIRSIHTENLLYQVNTHRQCPVSGQYTQTISCIGSIHTDKVRIRSIHTDKHLYQVNTHRQSPISGKYTHTIFWIRSIHTEPLSGQYIQSINISSIIVVSWTPNSRIHLWW